MNRYIQKVLTCLALALCISASFAGVAYAAHFLDYDSVVDQPSGETLTFQVSTSGEDFRPIVDNAEAGWDKVDADLNGKTVDVIEETFGAPANNDDVVVYAEDDATSFCGGIAVYACYNYRPSDYDFIVFDRNNMASLAATKRPEVALHEFGHALREAHHGCKKYKGKTVMVAPCRTAKTTPPGHDKADQNTQWGDANTSAVAAFFNPLFGLRSALAEEAPPENADGTIPPDQDPNITLKDDGTTLITEPVVEDTSSSLDGTNNSDDITDTTGDTISYLKDGSDTFRDSSATGNDQDEVHGDAGKDVIDVSDGDAQDSVGCGSNPSGSPDKVVFDVLVDASGNEIARDEVDKSNCETLVPEQVVDTTIF